MIFRSCILCATAVLAAGMTVAALPQKINLRERDKLLAELAEKMGFGIPSGTPEEMYTALAGEISAFGNSRNSTDQLP